MFTVKLAITHPTNVSAAYDPTQLPKELAGKAFAYHDYSLKNGLTNVTSTKVSDTRFELVYSWASKSKREEFFAAGGVEYQAFYSEWEAYVTSRGCRLAVVEETVTDVL